MRAGLTFAFVCVSAVVAAEPLKRATTTSVQLDRDVLETNFQARRDRCYVIVLEVEGSGRIDSADGAKTELYAPNAQIDGKAFVWRKLRATATGGATDEICPITTGNVRVRVKSSVHASASSPSPSRRYSYASTALGRGNASLQIWSRQMSAKELHAEIARQQGEVDAAIQEKVQWQRATRQSPACDACDRQHTKCFQRGGNDAACAHAWSECRSEQRCNAY
jgi:hypothetical protein